MRHNVSEMNRLISRHINYKHNRPIINQVMIMIIILLNALLGISFWVVSLPHTPAYLHRVQVSVPLQRVQRLDFLGGPLGLLRALVLLQRPRQVRNVRGGQDQHVQLGQLGVGRHRGQRPLQLQERVPQGLHAAPLAGGIGGRGSPPDHPNSRESTLLLRQHLGGAGAAAAGGSGGGGRAPPALGVLAPRVRAAAGGAACWAAGARAGRGADLVHHQVSTPFHWGCELLTAAQPSGALIDL